MAVATDLLDRLGRLYRIERTGRGRYLLTHVGDRELDEPAELELDDQLLEAYVARLAQSTEGGNHDAAVGLVVIHVEEEVESALATGGQLRSIGVRRNRISRRPEWFVDRIAGPVPNEPGPGTYEWRT